MLCLVMDTAGHRADPAASCLVPRELVRLPGNATESTRKSQVTQVTADTTAFRLLAGAIEAA